MKPNEKDLDHIKIISDFIYDSAPPQETITIMLETIYFLGANAGFDRANKIMAKTKSTSP